MSNTDSSVVETTPRKKLSILIVQMGGVDEVLRSLMALKAVRHLYPEMSIQVIARKEASGPLKRIEWLDGVLETPKCEAGEDPVLKVAQWIDQVINRNYDVLANWTFSDRYARRAAIITSLIPAMVKVGDYVRDDSTMGSCDAWSMYRQAWAKDPAIDQDIHHTDIITTELLTILQIHAGDPSPDAGSNTVTSKYFFKNITNEQPKAWINRPKGLKWVAVHADSLSERAAEWVQMVLRRNPDFGVVVIGDAYLGDALETERVITLGSDLHFDALVSVLSQASWLVSGKHPIVDLASLVNLRVFYSPELTSREFSLKWTEEGPYGNGHVAVSFENEWQPEVAYAAWSFYQGEWFHKNTLTVEGHFENLGIRDSLKSIQLFKSRIRPANEGGGVCYEFVAGQPREFEAWMYRVRGQMARAWFCGWLPSIEQEVAKLTLSPELVKRIRSVNDSVQVIEKLAIQGRNVALELSQCAQKSKTGYLMSVEDRDLIEEHGKKLLEVEALIARVIQVEPELRCLLRWYQQMMHNLDGQTVAQMAKETMQAFDLMTEGLELVSAYTKRTLDQAKPKSVTSNIRPIRDQDLNS